MTAPLLSPFLRIRITMYYDDHNPLTFMRSTLDQVPGGHSAWSRYEGIAPQPSAQIGSGMD